MEKRLHSRTALQQQAKSGIIEQEVTIFPQKLDFKPTIANISYGGMRLLFIPPLNKKTIALLKIGKINLAFEFYLPPSLKKLQVITQLRWIKERETKFGAFSIIGVQFLKKTAEFYREIEKFLTTPIANSEMFKNKRFFPRVHADINVTLTIQGIKTLGILPKYYKSKMVNVSAVGCKLSISPQLKPNEIEAIKKHAGKIVLKFLLHDDSKVFTFTGRIVYIKNIASTASPFSLLGIKFINLKEDQSEALIEYVCLKKVVFLKSEIDEMEKSQT